jgi:hypothetical protein
MGQLSRLPASALLMASAKATRQGLGSLSRALKALYPLPLALVTLYRIETYRGISAGWQKVALKASKQEAEALLSLLEKVRPDFYSRISSL